MLSKRRERRTQSGKRRKPWRRAALTALLCTAVLGAAPQPAAAQEWAVVDAFGYGGLGAATVDGVLMILWFNGSIEDDRHNFRWIAVGSGVGLAVGAVLGHTAESAVGRGEALGERHRHLVLAGGVLAGATLGTGLGLAHGCDQENESTCTGMTLAGTGLGAIYTWWRRDTLNPRAVDVSPTVTRSGEIGLRVRFGV